MYNPRSSLNWDLLIIGFIFPFLVGACSGSKEPIPTDPSEFIQPPTLMATEPRSEANTHYLPIIFMTDINALVVNPTPVIPTATLDGKVTVTTETCLIQPPSGWVSYLVNQGDTLWKIAQARSVSVEDLMHVNCRQNDDLIQGELLYVPPLSTQPTPDQPISTSTPTPTSSPTRQPTPIPSTLTMTPTNTYSPTPTATATPITPVPTTPNTPEVPSQEVTSVLPQN